MTEGRGFHKFALAFVQSLPVLVVAYLFSFVTETEIHSNTIFYLYLLHFVAFYVSDYNQDYFKRGHLVEFLQTLKYSLCFALAISFSSFLLEVKFSLFRRGLIYFLYLLTLVLSLTNYFIIRYWHRFYSSLSGSHTILLITAYFRQD